MKKQKLTKDTVPSGFTIPLVLTDAVPVLFFGGSMVLLSRFFSGRLFLFGASLCLYAGAAKVLWKLIVVTKQKNIRWMFLQMRYVMPLGFLLMLAALLLARKEISLSGIVQAMLTLPSAVFFAAGILCMVLMTVFAFTLDSGNAKANWIEQLTNGIAQAAFFIGILLL